MRNLQNPIKRVELVAGMTKKEKNNLHGMIKQQMEKRTDWGNLLKPGQQDLPDDEKSRTWRYPD
jgi:hypothetical protein